jgi:SPOR domain
MSMDGQPPDDLQQAVAATLRRLRGESRDPRQATPARLEPQLLSRSTADLGQPATVAISAGAPTMAQRLASDVAHQPSPEPDLLSAVTENAEIPPSPQSSRAGLRQSFAADVEAHESRQQRRHRLRYAVLLIVVASLAGVGWWAYRNHGGRLRGGEVPVIAADETPEKVAPAGQAATETSSDDKTVYKEIAPGGGTQQKSELLLPQPEAPALPPVPLAAAPSDANAGPAAPSSSSQAPAAPPAPAAAETPPTSDKSVASSAAETSAAMSPAPAMPLPENGPASDSPIPAVTASTQPAPVAEDTPTAAGNYRIQLAATKSEPAAEATWNRLTAKYQDILASLTLHVEKTDLGSKGIYYRVQAGPFADQAAAKDVCIKLKAKGQQCLVKP